MLVFQRKMRENRSKLVDTVRPESGNGASVFEYGKRACLHCLLTGYTVVLDFEWHWLFKIVFIFRS